MVSAPGVRRGREGTVHVMIARQLILRPKTITRRPWNPSRVDQHIAELADASWGANDRTDAHHILDRGDDINFRQ